MEEFKCPICGEPTNVYMGNARKDRLCRSHATELKNGTIEQCPNCGAYHKTTEPCTCKANEAKIKEKELTCILCGEISNGMHFCKSCYYKYKNKVLYLKVEKCQEFEKLDTEYSSDLVCDDGHWVKSPYEKIIDNWLYSENIKHAYENKIELDMNTSITPDFYITDWGKSKKIYVEFWGYGEENKQYQKTKEYKHPIYQQLVKENPDIAVVYLYKENVDKDEYKKIIKFAKPGNITDLKEQ